MIPENIQDLDLITKGGYDLTKELKEYYAMYGHVNIPENYKWDKESDKKMWYASRAYIRQYGPVSIHLNSYNAAINDLIPKIIEQKGTFEIGGQHSVKFENVHFQRPVHKEINENVIKINPKMCMDRKMSYSASIYVDITYIGPDNQVNVYKKKYIGDIPVMVKSELCNLYHIKNDKEKLSQLHEDVLDHGGYFIAKGSPKVLVPQVRPAHNLIHTYKGKTLSSGDKPKFSIYSETRSGSANSHTTNVQVGIITKTKLISVVVPYIDVTAIPLGIMFRALGAQDEEEMATYIFKPEWFTAPPSFKHKTMIELLNKSLEQSYDCKNQDDALKYIGKKGKKFVSGSIDSDTKTVKEETDKASISYAHHLMLNEFLPHIGSGENSFMKKRIFLGCMVHKLLMTDAGFNPLSDRDHFALKRIHTSGMLISAQFYNAFRQLISRITSLMELDIQRNNIINISSYIINNNLITNSLLSALTCNKWGSRGQTQGISQQMETFNRAAQICFLRKFIIPMNQDGGKIETPRHVQGSQWGISCPYSTPEGKKVGLVQGFSMGAYVTIGCDPEPITEILNKMNIVSIEELNPVDFTRYTKIFINGNPQGYTTHPYEIVNELRNLRRSACLNPEISIAYDKIDHDIRISTEAGRSSRAVAIAPEGRVRLTEEILDEIRDGKWDQGTSSAWIKLLNRGYVEILSKDEEEEMNIAIFPSSLDKMHISDRIQYTHCELSPDMIQGAGVSTSPHNHRNQAPRNIYQDAMSHQSIGCHANSRYGRKGKWHVLDYPQKPLVSTRISKELGFDIMGMGQNAMVAIMPWYGYNQEDSLIMSEASINRGFMNSTAYIAYEGTINIVKTANSNRYESFEIPVSDECNDFRGNAGKLIKDEEGYVYIPKGTTVVKDDILIGMTLIGTPENSIFVKKKTNISIRYDQKWEGVVHSVQCGIDGEGYPYIRLVVAQKRKPVLGDKFCLTPGHEVLTENGWKPISKIKKDESVATINVNTHDLEYQNVSETYSYYCDNEDLALVSTDKVNLMTTLNHKMFVSNGTQSTYNLVEAKDTMNSSVRYMKNSNNIFRGAPKYELNYDLDNFLVLLGGFLACSSTWIISENEISIGMFSMEMITKTAVALDNLNIKHVLTRGYITNIYNCSDLNIYFQKIPLNCIPDFCFSLNQEHSRILLEAVFVYSTRTFTSFPTLKNDIQRLALHAGWSVDVEADTNGKEYYLHLNKNNNRPIVSKENCSLVKYTGYVYCFEVPNHTFYVRSNGKGVWTGNSARHGQKGTVGAILPPDKMPFLKNLGYTPDILVNPLALPSRMTIGMLIEAIVGVALTCSAVKRKEYDYPIHRHIDEVAEYEKGRGPDDYKNIGCSLGDGTPYDYTFDLQYVLDTIKKLGVADFSEEVMINPITKKEIKCLIFNNIVYYQRLKHMVYDKIHSRARGPVHALHRQPAEGRRKGGGFRVGHMERDCLHGACISIHEEISIPIEQMSSVRREKVWGYNAKTEGLCKSLQSNFAAKGILPRFDITLEDGRVISATKCHPFMTESGEWSDLKDLKIGEGLRCSLSYCKVDMEKDFELMKNSEFYKTTNWNETFFNSLIYNKKLNIAKQKFSEYEIFRLSIRLARIVGLVTTDGHFTKTGSRRYAKAFLGHLLDVERFTDDIEKLTGYRPQWFMSKNTYAINIPVKLADAIRDMGVLEGSKVYQPFTFPNFITEDTPKPILREFLAGMFGGDGHCPCLYKKNDREGSSKYDMKSVSISWSKDEANLQSLIDGMNTIKRMLSSLGVKGCTVQNPKLTTNSKQNLTKRRNREVVLNVPVKELVSFSENVGFRYCVHKSVRLDLATSYRKFRENVLRQRLEICKIADKDIGYSEKHQSGKKKIEGITKAINKAVDKLKQKEPILHKYSIPDRKAIHRIIIEKRENEIKSPSFPKIYEYLKNVGGLCAFEKDLSEKDKEEINCQAYGLNRDDSQLPYYCLKIVDVRENGTAEMYDITVDGTESFIGNGVISHNCMLGQGLPNMTTDRLFHQSDEYRLPVCKICGLPATETEDRVECRVCNTTDNVVNVPIPFGTKLMNQELMAMNIVPRLLPK